MIIKGADILTPYGITKSGIVVIENGIIARISPMRDICPDAESRHEYEGEHEVVDGAGLTLVPGMPAEVLIQTAERTFFDYLSKPIRDSMNRAFRED